jgi:hypothetical protein
MTTESLLYASTSIDSTSEDLSDMGLNPDYLFNHQHYDPVVEYTNDLLPPSREATPVDGTVSWHSLSFLDDHFKKLADKWIMYSKKRVKRGGREVCTVQLTNYGAGYRLVRLVGSRTLPADELAWVPVRDLTELEPFYGSDQNHDRLWVIIDGKEAGRYCKAVSCPKEQKDTTVPIKYTVALADVKEVDGLLTTIIDPHSDHVQVYSTHVVAIWQADEVKAREPNVYVKYKQGRDVTAAKKRAERRAAGQRVKRSRKEIEGALGD